MGCPLAHKGCVSGAKTAGLRSFFKKNPRLCNHIGAVTVLRIWSGEWHSSRNQWPTLTRVKWISTIFESLSSHLSRDLQKSESVGQGAGQPINAVIHIMRFGEMLESEHYEHCIVSVNLSHIMIYIIFRSWQITTACLARVNRQNRDSKPLGSSLIYFTSRTSPS